ncbi:MAG: glycosyl hydrolase family 18 protein, partial [Bacillota bacterium]
MDYTEYQANADEAIDDMHVFLAMQPTGPAQGQPTGPTAQPPAQRQPTGPTAQPPAQRQTQTEAGRRTIDVNGYAFPNISDEVLGNTLPNLTFLSIFSYQVKPDGTLTPIDDTELIQKARAQGVAPMMVITNIGEDGFSSDIAHEVLGDTQVQQTLLNNVVNTLKAKNYYGLDIDFEYVYPDDREAYNRFLETVVARLRPLGYSIVSALAPKTS